MAPPRLLATLIFTQELIVVNTRWCFNTPSESRRTVPKSSLDNNDDPKILYISVDRVSSCPLFPYTLKKNPENVGRKDSDPNFRDKKTEAQTLNVTRVICLLRCSVPNLMMASSPCYTASEARGNGEAQAQRDSHKPPSEGGQTFSLSLDTERNYGKL